MGSAELDGRGAERRLRVSLPAEWLAQVWACGLTLTSRHLVVAVEQPGWPQARVLALRARGTEPHLAGRARQPDASPEAPRWELRDG